jgi:uncharacterized protein
VIIPDVNLLLYAYDAASPFHSKAAAWWTACLNGDETVGLVPVVLFGFLRIGTHPQAFHQPMSVAEAAAHARSWLLQPAVELLMPGPAHPERVLKLLEDLGTAGNIVTDAQIAASALEHDAVLHTTDADFIRFAGLNWLNPITGAASSGPRRRKLT